MDFFGIYFGVVELNSDPEKLGRLKVRVPLVYGAVGSDQGAIPLNDLPWAIPSGLPAGGSQASGGISWLPDEGDQVIVEFLDGEPEKPVWRWAMQSIGQADAFPLHQYETDSSGTIGSPKRAALVRYGSAIEWNAAGLIATTQHGYSLQLTDGSDSDGSLQLSTGAGQYLSFDDSTDSATLNVTDDLYFQIGEQLNILCENLRLETTSGNAQFTVGNDFTIDAAGSINLTASGDISLVATGEASLGFGSTLLLGSAANEPFVLGGQLVAFLNALLLYLSTHVHSNGDFGAPTGPPIIPPLPTVQPEVGTLISQTIFGR